MRIIAGKWKGRVLNGPTNRSTRPISDKVRGALFNVLGDVSGQTILDVYAGTGAVSFEALSRGAVLAEAVESDKAASKVIYKNAELVGAGDSLNLVTSKVEQWLDWPANQPSPRYDLIVADPPYMQLNETVLLRLANYLKPDGVLAVSHSNKKTAPDLEGLKLVQTKTYGDSALTFYQLE